LPKASFWVVQIQKLLPLLSHALGVGDYSSATRYVDKMTFCFVLFHIMFALSPTRPLLHHIRCHPPLVSCRPPASPTLGSSGRRPASPLLSLGSSWREAMEASERDNLIPLALVAVMEAHPSSPLALVGKWLVSPPSSLTLSPSSSGGHRDKLPPLPRLHQQGRGCHRGERTQPLSAWRRPASPSFARPQSREPPPKRCGSRWAPTRHGKYQREEEVQSVCMTCGSRL
jgi:hypothetical protein